MSNERAPLLPHTHPTTAEAVGAEPRLVVVTEEEDGMSATTFWRVGALFGATAVGLGAFGAHGLRQRIGDDPRKLANWATAAQYQLMHAGVVLIARGNPVACTLFTLGMTMFSGSIYALILDPQTFKPLGPVTPLGGLCLIAGWIVLLFSKSPGWALGFRR